MVLCPVPPMSEGAMFSGVCPTSTKPRTAVPLFSFPTRQEKYWTTHKTCIVKRQQTPIRWICPLKFSRLRLIKPSLNWSAETKTALFVYYYFIFIYGHRRYEDDQKFRHGRHLNAHKVLSSHSETGGYWKGSIFLFFYFFGLKNDEAIFSRDIWWVQGVLL